MSVYEISVFANWAVLGFLTLLSGLHSIAVFAANSIDQNNKNPIRDMIKKYGGANQHIIDTQGNPALSLFFGYLAVFVILMLVSLIGYWLPVLIAACVLFRTLFNATKTLLEKFGESNENNN